MQNTSGGAGEVERVGSPGARLPELGDQVLSIMADVEQRFAELRRASQHAAQEAESLSKREQEMAAQAADLEGERTRLTQRQAELEAALAAVAGQQHALSQQTEEIEGQRSAISAERSALSVEREALESRGVELEQRAVEIDVLRQTLEKQSFELKARIAETFALRKAGDQSSEQLRAAKQASEGLSARLEEAQREHAAQRLAWEREGEALSAKVREAEAQTALLTDRIMELEREAGELRKREEALTAEIAELRRASDGKVDARLLDAKESRIEDLERQLKEARTQFGAKEADTAEIEKRNSAIQEMAAHIRKLESDLAEARRGEAKARKDLVDARISAQEHARVADAADNVLSDRAEFFERRKARLALARKLVHERAQGSVRVKEIETQQAQASLELDVQRRNLSEARHALATAEQRMIRAWARSRATMGLFRMAMTGFVLATASVAVAFQFGPVTYLASATLQAKDRGGLPLTSQQAQQWSATHERMLAQESVVAEAAGRLGQRGFEDLSAPSALTEYLKKNLSMDTGKSGSIDLRLRAGNAVDGQRILDTYANALVSESNSERMTRVDGTVTELVEPAAVNPTPVDDGRMRFGAVVFGGLSAAAGVVWAALWARARRTRGLVPEVSDHEFTASSGDMLGVKGRQAA